MTRDGSEVRRDQSSPQSFRKPESSSLSLPLCEGIPVASDRSVVTTVQYPLAKSDGRALWCWIMRHGAHMHSHSLTVGTNEGGR